MNSNEIESLLDKLKVISAPIIGLIGVCTGIYQFYQLWMGDQKVISYIFTALCFLIFLFSLAWIGFRTKKEQFFGAAGKLRTVKTVYYPRYYRFARYVLALSTGVIIIGGMFLYFRRNTLDQKTVVLVTNLDATVEQEYRFTDILWSELSKEVGGFDDTILIRSDETISESQGEEHARMIGKQNQADIVIWGWYSVTPTNTYLVLHIELIQGFDKTGSLTLKIAKAG